MSASRPLKTLLRLLSIALGIASVITPFGWLKLLAVVLFALSVLGQFLTGEPAESARPSPRDGSDWVDLLDEGEEMPDWIPPVAADLAPDEDARHLTVDETTKRVVVNSIGPYGQSLRAYLAESQTADHKGLRLHRSLRAETRRLSRQVKKDDGSAGPPPRG